MVYLKCDTVKRSYPLLSWAMPKKWFIPFHISQVAQWIRIPEVWVYNKEMSWISSAFIYYFFFFFGLFTSADKRMYGENCWEPRQERNWSQMTNSEFKRLLDGGVCLAHTCWFWPLRTAQQHTQKAWVSGICKQLNLC